MVAFMINPGMPYLNQNEKHIPIDIEFYMTQTSHLKNIIIIFGLDVLITPAQLIISNNYISFALTIDSILH